MEYQLTLLNKISASSLDISKDELMLMFSQNLDTLGKDINLLINIYKKEIWGEEEYNSKTLAFKDRKISQLDTKTRQIIKRSAVIINTTDSDEQQKNIQAIDSKTDGIYRLALDLNGLCIPDEQEKLKQLHKAFHHLNIKIQSITPTSKGNLYNRC